MHPGVFVRPARGAGLFLFIMGSVFRTLLDHLKGIDEKISYLK